MVSLQCGTRAHTASSFSTSDTVSMDQARRRLSLALVPELEAAEAEASCSATYEYSLFSYRPRLGDTRPPEDGGGGEAGHRVDRRSLGIVQHWRHWTLDEVNSSPSIISDST